MAITDREIDQAFFDLKNTCGGVRNDYFGLLDLPQVAFGGNGYGIDGLHFDKAHRLIK